MRVGQRRRMTPVPVVAKVYSHIIANEQNTSNAELHHQIQRLKTAVAAGTERS